MEALNIGLKGEGAVWILISDIVRAILIKYPTNSVNRWIWWGRRYQDQHVLGVKGKQLELWDDEGDSSAHVQRETFLIMLC